MYYLKQLKLLKCTVYKCNKNRSFAVLDDLLVLKQWCSVD